MKAEAVNPATLLRQAGYRATPGRIRLLEVLMGEKMPLTVDQIHKKLGRSELNEVTLYRALEALVASQVVRRVNLQQGHAHHYEFADKHHHHIVCTKCERVEDFSDELCEEVVRKAARKSSAFNMVSGHSVELFGLCKTCA